MLMDAAGGGSWGGTAGGLWGARAGWRVAEGQPGGSSEPSSGARGPEVVAGRVNLGSAVCECC